MEGVGVLPVGDSVRGDESDDAGQGASSGTRDGTRDGTDAGTGRRWLLPLTLLPLVVSAVALLTVVGGDYVPTGDHAGTEISVGAVGRHEVLTGLWSHGQWSHPGPLSFYLLAPFYWLSGRSSVGLCVGALAINGASIAGMAVVARRRGGTPLLLSTLLACALVVRTLGADFVSDPQNIYIVTLPFGLMLFLTWAMLCGETWALPVGALTASFLAQTHVGFVLLAMPLLALGAAGLLLSHLRSDAAAESPDVADPADAAEPTGAEPPDADPTAAEPAEPEPAHAEPAQAEPAQAEPAQAEPAGRWGRWRTLLRPGLLTLGVLAVVWAPPVVDVVLHAPSNLRRIVEWFQANGDDVHTLRDGWVVVTGPFGLPPEWLTARRPSTFSGESAYLTSPRLPVLLILVIAALVVLWRRQPGGRALVVLTGAATALGIVGVARTLGPVFRYRLAWTWMLPTLAFAVVAWAAWRAVVDRWGRRADRLLTATFVAGLVVVTAVNVVTAATAGTPQADDSAMVADLIPQLVEDLDPDAGVIVVSDPYTPGSWYGRALVVQLEHRGFDVRVPPERATEYVPHYALRPGDGPVQARLVVVRGDVGRATVADQPGVRLVAHSETPQARAIARNRREAERVLREFGDPELTWENAGKDPRLRAALASLDLAEIPPVDSSMFAVELSVYLDEGPQP